MITKRTSPGFAEALLDHLVLADSPVVLDGQDGYTVITDQRVDEILPDLQAEVERHETHTPGHREALQRLRGASQTGYGGIPLSYSFRLSSSSSIGVSGNTAWSPRYRAGVDHKGLPGGWRVRAPSAA